MPLAGEVATGGRAGMVGVGNEGIALFVTGMMIGTGSCGAGGLTMG